MFRKEYTVKIALFVTHAHLFEKACYKMESSPHRFFQTLLASSPKFDRACIHIARLFHCSYSSCPPDKFSHCLT